MPYRLIDRVLMTRVGGRVERCHTIPHPAGYSVAAHSWGVALLMHHLWPEDFPRLGLYCLVHDVPEGWIGDIPSSVLGVLPRAQAEREALENLLHMALRLPSPNDLPPADQQKIDICDRLELFLWCKEQLACGNEMVRELHNQLHTHLFEVQHPPQVAFLLDHLDRIQSPLGRQHGVLVELLNSKEEAKCVEKEDGWRME